MSVSRGFESLYWMGLHDCLILTMKDKAMAYYVEMSNGDVVPCNWVHYEQLKGFGWVHRILTENQAVLHKLSNLRKGR